MVNSGLMKTGLFPKILACLLLTSLLIVNAAAAADFVWCFGSDGHLEFKPAADNACCANCYGLPAADSKMVSRLLTVDPACCGPCVDLFVKKAEVTLFKRYIKTSAGFPGAVQAKSGSPAYRQHPFAGMSLPAPPQRLALSLLVQRTVVLLN